MGWGLDVYQSTRIWIWEFDHCSIKLFSRILSVHKCLQIALGLGQLYCTPFIKTFIPISKSTVQIKVWVKDAIRIVIGSKKANLEGPPKLSFFDPVNSPPPVEASLKVFIALETDVILLKQRSIPHLQNGALECWSKGLVDSTKHFAMNLVEVYVFEMRCRPNSETTFLKTWTSKCAVDQTAMGHCCWTP